MKESEVLEKFVSLVSDASGWLDGGYRDCGRILRVNKRAEDSVDGGEPGADTGSAAMAGTTVHETAMTEAAGADAIMEPQNTIDPISVHQTPEAPQDFQNDESVSLDNQLNGLYDRISGCSACSLNLLRKNPVPGTGSTESVTLMIVTPPPFSDESGSEHPLPPSEREYLYSWLRPLGLDTERDIYITPCVKCRTPGRRAPYRKELSACSPYIREQYRIIRPKAILVLGESACGALTGNPDDFSLLAGTDWNWGAIPALVLWTPSEVLANPDILRSPVWEALKRLRDAWNAVS